MSELFDNIGADYLEQLLQAAMDGEVAQGDPAGGQIVGSIMLALISQGAGDRLDRYLRRTHGGPSRYELTCFDETYRPASRVDDLGAEQAVCLAARMAAAKPTGMVALVTCDDRGDERCVLLAKGPIVTFQFGDSRIVRPQPTGDTSALPDPGREPGRLDDAEQCVSGAGAEPNAISGMGRAGVRSDNDALATGDEEETTAMLRMIMPSAADIADLVVKRIAAS